MAMQPLPYGHCQATSQFKTIFQLYLYWFMVFFLQRPEQWLCESISKYQWQAACHFKTISKVEITYLKSCLSGHLNNDPAYKWPSHPNVLKTQSLKLLNHSNSGLKLHISFFCYLISLRGYTHLHMLTIIVLLSDSLISLFYFNPILVSSIKWGVTVFHLHFKSTPLPVSLYTIWHVSLKKYGCQFTNMSCSYYAKWPYEPSIFACMCQKYNQL